MVAENRDNINCILTSIKPVMGIYFLRKPSFLGQRAQAAKNVPYEIETNLQNNTNM